MKVKLRNKTHDTIAAVYHEDGYAIKPYKGWYDLEDGVKYFIVCSKRSFYYKDTNIWEYNYFAV